MSENPWELTEEEASIEITKWINEDSSVRWISLGRGHYEDVIPIVAHAAQRKLVEWLKGQSFYAVSPDTWPNADGVACNRDGMAIDLAVWYSLLKAMGVEP